MLRAKKDPDCGCCMGEPVNHRDGCLFVTEELQIREMRAAIEDAMPLGPTWKEAISAILIQFPALSYGAIGGLLNGCDVVLDLDTEGDREAIDLDEIRAWAKLHVIPMGNDLLVQWLAK